MTRDGFGRLQLADVGEENWMARGACVDHPEPDLFFPTATQGRSSKSGTDRSEPARAAQRICAGCTVSNECLSFALEHEEIKGVWGGTTTGQRRQYRAGIVA